MIRDRLQRMHLGEFIVGNSKLLRRTETTDEQASILDAMRVCEPPTIFHKDLSEANTT